MSHQNSAMIAGPSVYNMEPEEKEPVDTMPHDSQPPGVDEEIDQETD